MMSLAGVLRALDANSGQGTKGSAQWGSSRPGENQWVHGIGGGHLGHVKTPFLPIFQHSMIIFPPDFQFSTFLPCIMYLEPCFEGKLYLGPIRSSGHNKLFSVTLFWYLKITKRKLQLTRLLETKEYISPRICQFRIFQEYKGKSGDGCKIRVDTKQTSSHFL